MDKDRVKDVATAYKKHYETLAPNVQGFLQDYYTTTGKVFDITSGKRKPGQAGVAGDKSKYVKGEAIDISANHTEDYNYLLNTREGLSMLSKYNLGIIDETDPEMMKKTGATGAHFHIGTDSKFSVEAEERYNNFDRIQPVYSYRQRTTLGIPQTNGGNHFQGDGHNHEEDLATIGAQAETDFYNTALAENLDREMEKSIVAETKTEKSEARNELKQQQAEKTRERQIEEEFSKVFQQGDEGTYIEEYGGSDGVKPFDIPDMHDVKIQRSLPEMQTIFKQ